MPLTFPQAERAYRDDRISFLSGQPDGMRYLLLRSLSRAEHQDKLAQDAGVDVLDVSRAQRLRHLFDAGVPVQQMERTIREIHTSERAERAEREGQLITELYKMQVFDWGGLHQNSLEKTIVDNYVKKIDSFDRLNESIDNELQASMRGYVQCSWYNHWTSIIIEDIFKSHPSVLPSVGLIKKVDFFIMGVPFDLKVTYLPEGYVKEVRAASDLRAELALLKRAARGLAIHFDNTLPEARLLELLWRQLSDHPAETARALMADLVEQRRLLLQACVADPGDLLRWLYENQGVRRFDASNRFFLVLVNTADYFASWKLKRARDLLVQAITAYFDGLPADSVGRPVAFQWEGQDHTAVSDALFVVRGT